MGMIEKIDSLVRESASFKRIMSDGIVEDKEVEEQGWRVEALLAELERTLAPEQFRLVTAFMAELSVLQVVLQYNSKGGNISSTHTFHLMLQYKHLQVQVPFRWEHRVSFYGASQRSRYQILKVRG